MLVAACRFATRGRLELAVRSTADILDTRLDAARRVSGTSMTNASQFNFSIKIDR